MNAEGTSKKFKDENQKPDAVRVADSVPSSKSQVQGTKYKVQKPSFLLTASTSLANNSTLMKSPRFLLRGFRRPSELASLALGRLDRQVLEETWRRGETSVRDLVSTFNDQVAYTTVMTTLDRLY